MPARRQITWAKFRIAAVAICATAILCVLFYLLTGGTLLQAKTTLYVFIPDATGIAQGSPVRVNGIGVGKVRSVRLTKSKDPNRIVELVLTVEVDRLRSIPSDSYVQISSDTLIGDKFVDISSGRLGSIVAPGGELRYQPPTDIMKSLDLSQFQRQLRIVDATLTEIEQGKGRVGQFIASDDLYNHVRNSLDDMERGLTRAVAATGTVGAVLYSDEVYRKLAGSVAEIDDALARMQSGQGTGGQWLRDSGDYKHLLADVAGLRQSLAGLRAGRGPGGEFLTRDTLYADLNRKVSGFINAVDQFDVNPLLTTPALYDNLNGAAREAHDLIREFRQNPSKMMWMKLF